MLAIHLSEDFTYSLGNFEGRLFSQVFVDVPRPIGSRPKIESERDCGAVLLLDIFSKIKAVLRVESALVSAPSVLIQNVRKTVCVKQTRGGESEKDSAACRDPNLAPNFYNVRQNGIDFNTKLQRITAIVVEKPRIVKSLAKLSA